MTKKGMNKYVKRWISLFVLLTVFQVLGLYGVDRFLQPETAVALPEKPVPKEEEITLEIPPEANDVQYSPDKRHAAYMTGEGQLEVVGRTGVLFTKNADKISNVQWLSKTTLLYFSQTNNLKAYLVQFHGVEEDDVKSVLLHQWSGKKSTVQQVHFSPYIEFLYMIIDRGSYSDVYKYEAIQGTRRVPLDNVKLERTEYDDKTDVLLLYSESGKMWRYEKDTLYDSNGRVVRTSPPPVNHQVIGK